MKKIFIIDKMSNLNLKQYNRTLVYDTNNSEILSESGSLKFGILGSQLSELSELPELSNSFNLSSPMKADTIIMSKDINVSVDDRINRACYNILTDNNSSYNDITNKIDDDITDNKNDCDKVIDDDKSNYLLKLYLSCSNNGKALLLQSSSEIANELSKKIVTIDVDVLSQIKNEQIFKIFYPDKFILDDSNKLVSLMIKNENMLINIVEKKIDHKLLTHLTESGDNLFVKHVFTLFLSNLNFELNILMKIIKWDDDNNKMRFIKNFIYCLNYEYCISRIKSQNVYEHKVFNVTWCSSYDDIDIKCLLLLASRYDYINIIQCILDKYFYKLSTDILYNVFILGCKNNSIHTIKYLIYYDKSLDLLELIHTIGLNDGFIIACENGYIEIVKIILDYFTPEKKIINIINNDKLLYEYVQSVSQNDNIEMDEYVKLQIKENILINHTTRIDIINNNETTAPSRASFDTDALGEWLASPSGREINLNYEEGLKITNKYKYDSINKIILNHIEQKTKFMSEVNLLTSPKLLNLTNLTNSVNYLKDTFFNLISNFNTC